MCSRTIKTFANLISAIEEIGAIYACMALAVVMIYQAIGNTFPVIL